MGVEMRVHAFFPLLALVCLGISAADGLGRGLALFFVLVAAVVVRETARLLVAAWLGLRLRAILLTPIPKARRTPTGAEDSLPWRWRVQWPMRRRRWRWRRPFWGRAAM
jgi:hypothetical protein